MPEEQDGSQNVVIPQTVDTPNAGVQSRFERELQGPEPSGFNPEEFSRAQAQDKGIDPVPDTGAGKSRIEKKRESDQPKRQELKAKQEADPEPEPKEGDSPWDSWKPVTKKARDQWDAAKAKSRERESELQRQLLEARNAPNKELETLRAERDELQKALREVAIERDPTFNSRFQTQKDTAIKAAKLSAGAKGEELSKLLDLPSSQFRDDQIDNLISDLPAATQRRINTALSELDRIDLQRSAEIEHAKSTWDQRTQAISQQQQQQLERSRQEQTAAFDSILKEWQDSEKGHFLYQPDGENDAQINEQIQIARDIIDGKYSPNEIAKAALHAASIPRLKTYIEQLSRERDEALAQVTKLRGGNPGASAGPRKAAQGKPKSLGDPGYEDEFIANLMAAQNADRTR